MVTMWVDMEAMQHQRLHHSTHHDARQLVRVLLALGLEIIEVDVSAGCDGNLDDVQSCHNNKGAIRERCCDNVQACEHVWN